MYDELSNVDYVPTNLPAPNGRAVLVLLEDNDPVIQICIKGRNPTLRHVPRVHRVNTDACYERRAFSYVTGRLSISWRISLPRVHLLKQSGIDLSISFRYARSNVQRRIEMHKPRFPKARISKISMTRCPRLRIFHNSRRITRIIKIRSEVSRNEHKRSAESILTDLSHSSCLHADFCSSDLLTIALSVIHIDIGVWSP